MKRMVDACTEAKVPLPRYELRPGCVAIIFNRPKKAVSGNDVTENVTVKIISNISDRQRLIIKRLIETGVANVTENITENVTENATSLTELFNVTERTIKRDLSKLQSLGILKHEGPDKGGKWVVLIQFKKVK